MNLEYQRIVQTYGGAISFSDCHPRLWEVYVKLALTQAEQKAKFVASPLKKQWEGRPVFTAIINSDVVNACAIPGVEADFVLIYRGLMERILGYALALFATQEFLPNVGESHKELPYRQTMVRFDQRVSLKTGRASLEPRDPIRAACGIVLCMFAVDLVLSHEFGHIAGGHFALLRNPEATPPGIDELGAQKGNLESAIPLACLEWDADHYASALSWSILEAVDVHDAIAEAFARTYTDQYSRRIVAWSLAAHIFFRCLAVEGASVPKFAPDMYPPPSLRGLCFMLDLLKRTSFVHGANPVRDSEVGRLIAGAENLAKAQDGIVLAGHDWFHNWSQTRPEWYEGASRLFHAHRNQLEEVRRTEVTWRPIWSEKV